MKREILVPGQVHFHHGFRHGPVEHFEGYEVPRPAVHPVEIEVLQLKIDRHDTFNIETCNIREVAKTKLIC